MTAPMVTPTTRPAGGGSAADAEWAAVAAQAPLLAQTAARYLAQIAVSLRPASVVVADATLRLFAGYLVAEHPAVTGFGQVRRPEVEGFKGWLAVRRAPTGNVLSANTIRQRLGTLRTFFDRIIEWDWPDAPARVPIFSVDLPVLDYPLPKFLDDAQAARLLRAASADPDPLRRLVVHLLARTGLRVGELCALASDAVVQMSSAWWLRVPLGKLHNDRYVPLHPQLVDQLADWADTHHDAGTGLLLTRDGRPLNRFAVARILDRVAGAAGLGHVHPHQLRHTLATQAINRGMRIEAIAAMLGHRTLRMTLIYARIANRTVAEQYHAVSQRVDALYTEPDLPGQETTAMRRLREEHRRMLGNGWCTRPPQLDCAFETICEGCGFFQPTIEFRPTLQAQRDHASTHDQDGRAELYQRLIDTIDQATA
jgi:site-specific recombinase XerD